MCYHLDFDALDIIQVLGLFSLTAVTIRFFFNVHHSKCKK